MNHQNRSCKAEHHSMIHVLLLLFGTRSLKKDGGLPGVNVSKCYEKFHFAGN